MDIFDAIFIGAETYINIKNDMKYNDDPLESLFSNILKSKYKVDKMYEDEIKEINKRSDIFWELLD